MATGGEDCFMSDEILQNACCGCSKKGQRREGDKYCVECTNYYCSLCVGIHKVVPSMETHHILDTSNFNTLKKILPSYPILRCKRHPSQVVDLYCGDHDEVACASCIALDHRFCGKVNMIADNVHSLYKESKVNEVMQCFRRFKSVLEEDKKTREVNLKDLQTSLNLAVQEVQTFTKTLQSYIAKTASESIAELKNLYRKLEASIEMEINEIIYLTDTMDKLTAEFERTEGNKAQEFACVKSSEKISALAQELIERHKSHVARETVVFTADESVETYLKKLEAIGKISKIQTCNTTPPGKSLSEKVDANEAGKALVHKVKRQREINVKIPYDDVCYITGICMTADGNVILADFKNNKLKRLDLSREAIVDYIVLEGQPWAVHSVGMYHVVASFSRDIIKFVSVKKKLNITSTLKFNHSCWGVAYHNEKLFISDGSRTIYIHNMKGQELRKISKGTSGIDIFQNTRHIAISDAGDRVYVADLNNGLIILDIEGNHLSTLCEKDIQISGAYGVCTDGRNVLVSGLESGNVVQIGQDNTFLGQIEIVFSPRSLSFDAVKSSLYVTRYEDNKIVVLDVA